MLIVILPVLHFDYFVIRKHFDLLLGWVLKLTVFRSSYNGYLKRFGEEEIRKRGFLSPILLYIAWYRMGEVFFINQEFLLK